MCSNIKAPRSKLKRNQEGKRSASRKPSLAVRGNGKKRSWSAAEPRGKAINRDVKEAEEHKAAFAPSSRNRPTARETRAACASGAAGRARPPTVKEQAAKYLVKLNVVASVTCCFIPGCFEKVTEASSDLSAALSCEFTESRGGTVRGQTWCLSLTKGVAGEPHTCQLRLPQIFLGIDQTTVCKY